MLYCRELLNHTSELSTDVHFAILKFDASPFANQRDAGAKCGSRGVCMHCFQNLKHLPFLDSTFVSRYGFWEGRYIAFKSFLAVLPVQFLFHLI